MRWKPLLLLAAVPFLTGASLNNGEPLRFFEPAAQGQNYVQFAPPAAITTNQTCTFENDSSFIPDSCVGDGSDATGVADADYGDITVSGSGTVWTIDPNSIALGTDTTGNYVGTVADGTGIDGTASSENATYTPTLDLSEMASATWGTDNFTTETFSTAGADMVWDYSTAANVTLTGSGTSPVLGLDDQGTLRIYEEDANGANYKAFQAPSIITANTTCTFEDDASFIPDSCVGNGVDDVGSALADADYGDVVVSGSGTVWTIDSDSVVLGTDTTGNYVATVADGTGIDGTASGEGSTYTPSLDLTEVSSAVLGNGTTSTLQVGTIELGAATDTTLSRTGAGDVAIEGNAIVRSGTTAGGDLTGTYPNPTVAANSIALGTDTTGNYQADTAAGTGIAVTGTPGEGWTATVALDFSDAGANPSLTVDQCRFSSNATTAGYIVCEGDTADNFESRIMFTDPTADRVMTIPNADSNPVQPLTCGSTDKVTGISSAGVISCGADAGAAGSGDNIRVEDSDNAGTYTDASDADFDDSGDINFAINTASSPDQITATVRADSVALGTDTTGNYVASVAEGSAIDVTGTPGEGWTATVAVDLTELSSATFGAGAFTTLVFDAGATDPTFTMASNSVTVSNAATFSLGTSAAFTTGTIELGAASDTTLARSGAGDVTIEGNAIVRSGTTAGGDLTGTFPSPTIAANSIALTTDTTGNYVDDVIAGTGIAVTHTPGEGSDATVAFSYTDKGTDVTLNADECVFSSDATTAGNIVCEGDTANTAESRMDFGDPSADRVFTLPDANSYPITDKDYGDVTVSASGQTWAVDADSITLGTDTTGVYVSQVADGTGIDGTCNAETCTYTPTLDLTELSTATFGAGAFTTLTFDAGATDPTFTFASNSVTVSNAATFSLGTSAALTTGTIELGAATDTTLARSSAGNVSIEGNVIVRAGSSAGGDLTGTYPNPTITTDAVALTTDTTGNYVGSVADGTGIDGTASGEGATYTPTLDLTEVSSATWGAGSFTSFTFDAGATDPVLTFGSGTILLEGITSFRQADAANAGGQIRLLEDPGTGSNYIAFAAPASITSNVTCTLEDDANPIPDSCVGDGTDGGGGGGTPGGSDTQVQYNDGGAFGGDAGLTFDETNNVLTVSARVDTQSVRFSAGITMDSSPFGVIRNFTDGIFKFGNWAEDKHFHLVADAADTLALREGTDAQTFRLYKTYTDASNYERLGISCGNDVFASGGCDIGTDSNGTGGPRTLNIGTLDSAGIYFVTASNNRWAISSSGNIEAWSDNANDIGASGANRPRTAYFATSAVLGGNTTAAGSLVLLEDSDNGTNTVTFTAPASVTSNRTCVLVDLAAPIPDSCVGDGVDAGAGGGLSNVVEDTSPTLGGNLEGGGFALGTTGSPIEDLFLASGAVINWNSGGVTLTHSAGGDAIYLQGGNLWFENGQDITDSTGTSTRINQSLGLSLGSSQGVNWSNDNTASPDLSLFRDASDVLAQRRSTNAQTFRLYNTYTDASNYERLAIHFSGNNTQITNEAAGTGSTRRLSIVAAGSGAGFIELRDTTGLIMFGQNSVAYRWQIEGDGHLRTADSGDNVYDIGSSGTNRPRTGYFATSAVLGGNATAAGSLVLLEDSDNGTNTVTFTAPASVTSNRTCVLVDLAAPIPDSCVGDGVDAGAGGGSPGGSDTQVQYNDGGAFGGDSGLTFAEATDDLAVGGDVTTTDDVIVGDDITMSGANSVISTSSGNLSFQANGNVYMFGTATSVPEELGGVSVTPSVQVSGTGSATSTFANNRFSADANPPRNFFGKSRGATIGDFTIVQANDQLGEIVFGGADGSIITSGAYIRATVDGTPGTDDMPGAIFFATTADGSQTPTDRWKISNAGHLLAATDNSWDIGATGATRPRDLFLGGDVTTGDDVIVGDDVAMVDTGAITWAGGGTGSLAWDATGTDDLTATLGNESFPQFRVVGTNASTDGPGFVIYQNSASPAAGDLNAFFEARGNDSGGNFAQYQGFLASIVDPTDTSEDGKFGLYTLVAGARVVHLTMDDIGMYMPSGEAFGWNNDSSPDTSPSMDTRLCRDAAGTIAVKTTDCTTRGVLEVGTIELGADSDTTIARVSAGVISVEGVAVATFGTGVTGTLGTLELGAASDTTIARSGAGAITVEGVQVVLAATSPTLATITTTGNIELGNASDTTLARSAAGEATLEGDAVKHSGKQMMWIPAAAMKNSATSPASCGDTYDSGSNDITISVCAFDSGATEERAEFQIAMPKAWNEGTLTFQTIWTATSSSGTANFELACVAISNDDPLNATLGTAQTSNDTLLATNDSHEGPESSAITCGGTPAENDLLAFRISRDTSVDTLAADALLIGIKLYWTDNASTLAE